MWQRTAFPFVLFSPLDELGRAGPAYACLGPETLPTDVRQPMGNIQPSGWQNTRYDDLVDGGNLFNRSHLIGYQLCGDSGALENLITGTRNLNAGSMLLVETAVEMYIEETGHHVLYRVTPFYHGDDLVPFGVQMEAQSMETDEEGISCNLFLYNVQPGIEIDYATGTSWRAGVIFPLEEPATAADNAIKMVPAETSEPEPESAPVEVTYVLNKNTHKFHYPDCNSVSDMKAKTVRMWTGPVMKSLPLAISPAEDVSHDIRGIEDEEKKYNGTPDFAAHFDVDPGPCICCKKCSVQCTRRI